MRLLLIDQLRRTTWWITVLLLFMSAFGWYMLAELRGYEGRLFCWSMGAVFALGPQQRLTFFPRALWYLPVSSRDLWRAGWLLGTLGVTTAALLMKAPALLIASNREVIGVPGLLLSTVYDFIATGVGCVLAIAVSRPRPAYGWQHRVWPAIQGFAMVSMTGGLLLAGMLPKWDGVAPPVRWTDLSETGWIVVTGGIALTLATYFHSPRPQIAPPVSPETPAPPRVQTVPRERSGLTGMPRLLLHEYVWTLLIGGALASAGAAIVLLMAGLIQAPRDLLAVLTSALQALEGNDVRVAANGYGNFNLLIWFAFFAASLAARFPAMVRHLRVLPIGVDGLNALLLLWPGAIWLTVWTAVAILRSLILGEWPPFHTGLLAGLVGTSALVQSLSWHVSGLSRLFVFGVAAGLAPALHYTRLPPPAALAVLGVASLAAAALLNRRALFSSATYKVNHAFIPAPMR